MFSVQPKIFAFLLYRSLCLSVRFVYCDDEFVCFSFETWSLYFQQETKLKQRKIKNHFCSPHAVISEALNQLELSKHFPLTFLFLSRSAATFHIQQMNGSNERENQFLIANHSFGCFCYSHSFIRLWYIFILHFIVNHAHEVIAGRIE